ncbi:MAG TPA: UDP-3-O-(3-hydroxymyristoyl)glucosamine N-acyltransferase [Blastocatellia bacterium]|jgi:UDP-3-O-[3-hydroxymyristoyl] glucosamine N-acyltransferase|nr:UDP-3-O-(3-hydroxymyristoyl)glucosamine N-acyltransferase [Blastocatellia bacterium]HAF21685.1 UDP-3-O-(3-hydroxymyristoyl)glucosamine N-acyltransferase [Blastocatellia bacterium]HCX28283.1 UDP-3-O-(3-hydroxymyristoyl)glucosamine N-acyltransferase [Blastocatellia bacterium]
MKLSELASLTGAHVDGNSAQLAEAVEITGAAGLDDAGPGNITFLANPRYTPKVNTTQASAIYLSEDAPIDREIPILRAREPYLAYTRALRLFHPEPEFVPFIHESAVIDSSADVAENVWIGANSVIGPATKINEGVKIHPNVTIYEDVVIGKNSTIHAGAVIRERSQIGERVVIHNNVVVGCDGFGYAKDEQRSWLKIPQTGRVVVEDDVEIGAGTTIDRASVGESRIGRGTKIDNLVQIGHSCTVGEDTLLCAQVGLAGSSHIGDRVILAGQAGVAGHNTIGDDVVLTAKSATSHDVPAGKVISGIPAFDNRDWLRSTAAFRRLGEMQRKIRELEKKLEGLMGEGDRSS